MMTDFLLLRNAIHARLCAHFNLDAATAPRPVFTPPPAHVSADICLPWAMSAAKVLKRSPLELAKGAAEEIGKIPGVGSAVVAPPGYVNITFSAESLSSFVSGAAGDFPKLLVMAEPPKDRTLIEFVSANPTGPLHLASGRAAALGDSLVRVMRALGWQADAEYYVNDAGNQAQLLGLSLRARHEGKELPENGYKGEYIKELAAQIPPGSNFTDEEYALFAIDRMLSMHKADMELFRVEFQNWFRESRLHKEGALQTTLDKLRSLGMVYEKEGAVWFGSTGAETEEKDDKDRVLVRADKRPTYFLADLAYHKDKYDRGYTRLVDILGADHHGYVPRMKAGVAAMGFPPKSFEVVIHQLVFLFRDGKPEKMSKREGEFIRLRELAEDVGVDACRFFFASRTPNSHLNFDIELAKKKSQENPVFYVQYVHARICSIFKGAEEKGFSGWEKARFSAENLTVQERQLLTKLVWMRESLEASARDLSVHHITNYLTELASLYHPFYDNCRVLDEANRPLTVNRLLLCAAVKNAIAEGLCLIAVSAPEQM